MITIIQSDNVYEVRFQYDPDLVALIKTVPGKQWFPEGKFWTIPSDKLGWFLDELKGTVYQNQIALHSQEAIGVNATLDITAEIPDIDISDIHMYVKPGASIYAHQRDFMKYAIDRERHGRRAGFILADEQGAGKTLETMNLAMYHKEHDEYKHCLVICCVNTSKYNWCEDVAEHTSNKEKPYILGTRLKRDKVTERYDTGNKERLEDLLTGHMYGKADAPELPYFIVTNIETLRMREGKRFPIVEALINMIDAGQLNMIAIDEIHKNASPGSLQGKCLIRLKEHINTRILWLPITGTPIVNKPTDVYLPLKLVDGHSFRSFYTWCNEFVLYGGYDDHDIVGYKNIPRLKAMLQANMIRRLKKDTLKDLPPKIFYTEYVENTSYQQTLYKRVVMELKAQKNTILSSLNPMTYLLRLRQINGSPELVDPDLVVDDKYIHKNAKLQRVMELLAEAAERGEKTLIYSNWVEPLRTLYKFVSQKYKTCCYVGPMSEELRQKHKHAFMTNPAYTVMIGTIGAMGVSHTLTAANNVIFYDEPWTPADRDQAIDRTHRPGAVNTINIYTLLSHDTVDDRVHSILYNKEQVSKYIVDNGIDLYKNPDLFDILLGDTRR